MLKDKIIKLLIIIVIIIVNIAIVAILAINIKSSVTEIENNDTYIDENEIINSSYSNDMQQNNNAFDLNLSLIIKIILIIIGIILIIISIFILTKIN